MPPMRSAGARYLSPNMAPTLTPMADSRQVITPISPAAGRMSTCMAAKLTPTANINAGGDGQRQRSWRMVVVQLLVAAKALLDHVRTDERQQYKRDPRAELRQQRGKPVAEK